MSNIQIYKQKLKDKNYIEQAINGIADSFAEAYINKNFNIYSLISKANEKEYRLKEKIFYKILNYSLKVKRYKAVNEIKKYIKNYYFYHEVLINDRCFYAFTIRDLYLILKIYRKLAKDKENLKNQKL